ncbi:lipid-binding protein [Flavobacterium sp. LHD-85]|uniref:lipid-binding protein n=1 Tax=Flavobacterium sp. LHD-85 TaxID=3071410 RepID=UPI0027E18F6A|nr:lipid-binding protein [Flavobacterium sp. LHD-85]MDQ6529529.1 lipid-binding protein [Flavobacterium sp. LHD-85]
MKKLKLNITRVLVAILVLTSFVACDEVGDTDPGGTSTESMAGDWYVQTLVNGVVVHDYALISTYNTAANDGKEFWIDDHGNVWDFKVKSPATVSSLSFAGSNLASSVDGYDVTVNITDGKVTKNDTKSSGGHTVDGISFKATFSDDDNPGTVYEIKGYKRTGFPEDEH